MPFTPFHMGPGIVVKSFLQGRFSLIVFGWAQIVSDIQPLIVLITGKGSLHGFSHTYAGAIVLSVVSALSGKYLSEVALFVLDRNKQWQVKITWWVSFLSAFIGTFCHVLLDSIMHSDVEPFFPVHTGNSVFGLISTGGLHKACLFSVFAGGIFYFAIKRVQHKRGWLSRIFQKYKM